MADRAALEQAKVEAAVGTRALAELGIAVGIRSSLGHASMRVPGDPNLFVVKGRGYRMDVLSRMRPEDMVVCDLEGNWVDGPPYSSQCSEVKIHSCIYRARPDVVSITHAHPDYTVLMSVFQTPLAPMAQEGSRVVARKEPIPILPQMKIISTEEEGVAVAEMLGGGDILMLLGHGAVTASTQSVQQSVMTMAWLEHQARLNYMAMCAGGPNHPTIPMELATQPSLGEPPHIAARVAQLPGGQRRFDEGGVWAYIREVVGSDM